MGYSITKNDNETIYGIKELVCDTQADISSLPVSYKPGSSAFCLEDSTLWILDTKKSWKQVFGNGGGSSSGGGSGSGGSSSGGDLDLDYATNEDIDTLF